MKLRENRFGHFLRAPDQYRAGQRAALSQITKGKRVLAALLIVALLCLVVAGCAKRTPPTPEVRIDLVRAMQFAHGSSALKSLTSQSIKFQGIPSFSPRWNRAERVSLAPMKSPPVSNLIKQRREEAAQNIQRQRQSALDSLIQAAAAQMHAQSPLWRQELMQSVDYTRFEEEWYQRWREAFERSAARRYPLLFEQSRLNPMEPEFLRWKAELDMENQLWLKEQSELLQVLEQHRQRAMEEVEVMLNQRKQAFLAQATRDANAWLSQQPKLNRLIDEDFYQTREAKPVSERLQPPSPVKSISKWHEIEPIKTAWNEASRAQIKRMAEEWAAQRGYRLSQSQRAPDKTEEFLYDYARLSSRGNR